MKFDTLQSYITHFATVTPEKLAIKQGDVRWTYGELEHFSNRVAHYCTTHQDSQKMVLVMLDKSPELIGTILGILKAGGIFIPLDPNYPAARLRAMIEEVPAQQILLRAEHLGKLNQLVLETGRELHAVLIAEPVEVPEVTEGGVAQVEWLPADAAFVPSRENLSRHAYIYFTSGSTGTPKGVLGRHRSLLHFIEWEIREFGITSDWVGSQLTSPSFDPFLRDIFVPLCAGGTVVIPPTAEVMLIPQKLCVWLEEERVGLIHMTPSLFKNLLTALDDQNHLPDLRYIFLAGEKLKGRDVQRFFTLFQKRIQLVNLYGPTETTLAKFFYRVQPEDAKRINIPVGKPIDRTELLLLDAERKRCRTETVGEVYIRTPFISSGYYNRPELTREVFLPNPFTGNPQDIIYKTGDLGLILPDGNLELVGRVDHQVKIRGMRVEPGEIETQILAHTTVKETLVLVQAVEDGGGRETLENDEVDLVAYLVWNEEYLAGDESFESATKTLWQNLKADLSKRLPEHMIPVYFVSLQAFPLTPNGKVDRQALPRVEHRTQLSRPFVGPTTPLEVKLVKIWEEVLGIAEVGVEDDFFELGGHSLKAANVVARVYKELQVEIGLRDLFAAPTIRALAGVVAGGARSTLPAIGPCPQAEYYPLSSAQKRLYFLHQLSPNSSYNLPRALQINGQLDRVRLEQAIERLVARHESLRTSFAVHDGEPLQRIATDVNCQLEEWRTEQVDEALAEFIRPFDLTKAPLFRVGVIETAEHAILCFDLHHSIADGSSLGILVQDFLRLYRGEELPPLSLQYKDYAVWQKSFFASEAFQKEERFWLERFAGEIPVLSLPTDRPRPVEMSFAGATLRVAVPLDLTVAIRKLAQEEQATLFMVLLATYTVLLARYSGQEEIIVGTPVANRRLAEMANVLGMFVNTLGLQNFPQRQKGFRAFLAEVKSEALAAFENEDYPLEMLIDRLQLARDLSRNPLFDTVFVVQNAVDEVAADLDGLQVSPYGMSTPFARFDLAVNVSETIGGLDVGFTYSTDLFTAGTVERLANHWLQLLRVVVAEPDCRIGELEMLSSAEKRQLLWEFSNSSQRTNPPVTLTGLLERKASEIPEAIAVELVQLGTGIAGDSLELEALTYGELNRRANQVAWTLRKHGVGREDVVALVAEPSLELAIGLLAILKAGGAYLPQEPTTPPERLRFILQESGTKLLLLQGKPEMEMLDLVKALSLPVLRMEEEAYPEDSGENLPEVAQERDAAYIIYTSGSTGQPKGVVIEHRSIVNTLLWRQDEYQLGENDRVLQLFSFTFDGFATSFYTPLLSGGRVIFPGQDGVKNPRLLKKVLQERQITHCIVTPTLYAVLLDLLDADNQSLQTVVLAGDRVNPELVQKTRRRGFQFELVNEYGPTENSVATTVERRLQAGEMVTIGRPVPNTWVYILNPGQQPQPVGVPGELWISGTGLARHYLNRPELSAERFQENPFRPGERIYRTGDLARWLPDGRLEFIGRCDEQVKIRGYRIETGEIENHLLKHPAIQEVVVLDRNDATRGTYLVAYYVPSGTEELTQEMLREYLHQSLPLYMCPGYFIALPELPRLPGGKINRKGLPAVEVEMSLDYLPPRTGAEEVLAQIWCDILGEARVGRMDNFFDLGGDSIKAIQIIARAGEQGLHLTVKDIFRHKTVAGIVEHLQDHTPLLSLAEALVVGEVPLTPVQSWFFGQKLPHPEYFHQANLFTVPSDADQELLERAIVQLIERHDALRMSYAVADGRILQYNRGVADVDFQLVSVDLSTVEEAAQGEAIRAVCEELQASCRLFSTIGSTGFENLQWGRELLFKAALLDLGTAGKRLFLAFHHLLIDGVSWRILLTELESLYRSGGQSPLPPKTTSFKEWSEGLQKYAAERILDVSYWEQIDLAKCEGLTDGQLSLERNEYAIADVVLTEVETHMLLTQANQAYGTNTEDLLLTGFALSMQKVFGLQEFLVTLEGHGREEILAHTNLSRTVGWFTTAYPVVLEVHADLPQTIISLKESLRRIPQRGLNFGLARYLQHHPHLARLNPEITFNYLGQFAGAGMEEGQQDSHLLSPAQEETGLHTHPANPQATFLDCTAAVAGGRLQMTLRYHPAVISREKARELAGQLSTTLKAICVHCSEQPERVWTATDVGLQHLLPPEDFAYLLSEGVALGIPEFSRGVPQIYGLTPMQQGMLFHSLYEEQSRQYVEQICFYLEGAIQSDLLQQAWQTVCNRHEALRFCFVWKKLKNPVQLLLPTKEVSFWEEDLTGWGDEAVQDDLARLKEQELARKMDFAAGDLNRLAVVRLRADRYFVCWTFHHILMDGWSGALILRELVEVYQALLQKKPLPLAPARGFTHYLDWLREQDTGKALYFWRHYLEDLSDAALLTGVLSGGKPVSSAKVLHSNIQLTPEQTREIEELCKENQITLSTYVQVAWGLLLTRYTNRSTCCFGMTVAGRPAEIPGIEEMVGLLINTLPVLFKPEEDLLLGDLLQRHNEELVEMREYEFISLVDLQKMAPRAGQLFDSLVVFENYPVQSLGDESTAGVQIRLDSTVELTNYPVVLTASVKNGLSLKLTWREDCVENWLAERMSTNLAYLLEEMMGAFNRPLKEIEMITPAERAELLAFNETEAEYEREKTVIQLFQEQAWRTPDQPALVCDDVVWTYGELSVWVDLWAQALRREGAGPGAIIGILLEPSVEMFAGILATLQTGAAYLPLDPEYPAERIRYMVRDSKAMLLISRRELVEEMGLSDAVAVLPVEDLPSGDWPALALSRKEVAASAECCTVAGSATDAAYIIYTSGSTGQPKGVVVEHRALLNLVTWHNRYYAVTANDRSTKYAGTGFDASVWEIFPYLVAGATIYVVPTDIRHDLVQLDAFLASHGITISFLPTLVCEELMRFHAIDSGSQHLRLRYLLTGGDKLRAYYPASYQVVNNYGPTENTVVTTCYPVKEWTENIPVGRPVANTQVYILDRFDRIQPLGALGELCITGDGLARGYLHRPDLTAERFVSIHPGTQRRMYKTGDLVRMLPDGNLLFLGRSDEQVQIRGYRVEPGEIEQVLRRDARVKEAIVLERKDANQNSLLILYYTAVAPIDEEELLTILRRSLPEYMLPARLIYLEQIPQTPNGKIDRKALLELDQESPANAYEPEGPQNPVEAQLAMIWAEVLGVTQVRRMDHFFELGGHSLKATQLASRIEKVWNLEVSLRDIFQYPTLQAMATHLQNLERKISRVIEPVSVQPWYPVSSAQKRIYALYMLNPASTAYNIPAVLRVTGALDYQRFSWAMQQLVQRHDALRTSFSVLEGEVLQRVEETVAFAVENAEVRDEEVARRIRDFIRPFDVSVAPLVRASLLKMDDQHLLLLDLHHLIADGSSVAILMDELAQLYQGGELSPLRIQYKDYAVWQQGFLRSEAMAEQERYWLEKFAGEIPVLNLPTDYPRPQKAAYAGARFSVLLDPETSTGLGQLALETGTTLFMTLLTGYGVFLGRYSGQEDIVIGTPVAGRNHPDLEHVTGMFVNSLPMRVEPAGEKSVRELLLEVREIALEAYANQDYPLESLLEQLSLERDLSRNPLFDTMLALQNTPQGKVKLALEFEPYPFTNPVSKFDLTVNAVEEGDEIRLSWEYRTGLFQAATVERMARHYCAILRTMVADPEQRIAAVQMLSEAEREQVLCGLNQTRTEYPRTMVIQQLFEEQVRETPDQWAVVSAGQSLTYRELNERANQLARLLRQKGIGPEQIVGIMTDPLPEMLVGILAILKAGGTYLPIDPTYPQERIRYMLELSSAPLLLIRGQRATARLAEFHATGSKAYAGEVLDLQDEALYQGDASDLTVVTQPANLAYVIFTSGSTGQPKGVMVEHRSLVNLTCWHQQHSAITAADRSTKYAGFGFDASVLEIFPYITAGATIYMIPEEMKLNLDALAEFFTVNQITTSFLPTPVYEQFMEKDCPTLRQLLTGGDKLRHYSPQHYAVIDNYGPAENTVTTTVFTVEREVPNIPVGKPISNVRVYILSAYGYLQPVGVPGELCIAGEGLARGYLGRADLTAERFLPDPFYPGERMYKTGDLARWLSDGNLEFLGRIDEQVKIRGYRIEPGEIESQLRQHADVRQAVVLLREDGNGAKYLAAYIVLEHERSIGELRAFLAQSLPEYMIPNYFVQLPALPLTPNGKVDKRALPEPDLTLVNTYSAPETEVEQQLAEIWSGYLSHERVGVDDNFFELGGDSIKAIQIQAKASQVGIYITVEDIFQYKTIAQILAHTEYRRQVVQVSDAEVSGELPLTPVQNWFFEQNLRAPHFWNQTNLFALPADVDLELLEKALQKLIAHHDGLRMTFQPIVGKYIQINRAVEEVAFPLMQIDLSLLEDREQEAALKDRCFALQDAVDLARDLLFKAVVFDLGQRGKRLFIMVHHLLIDGISWRVIVEDLELLYQSKCQAPLPPKSTSYKEWSEKLLTYATSSTLETQYWSKLAGFELPRLRKGAEPVYLKDFLRESIELEREETDDLLRKAHQTYNTRIQDLLLAGLLLTAHEELGLPRLFLTLEGHGREPIMAGVELSRTVGWFTAIYPVELMPQPAMEETITHVKETLRRVAPAGLQYGLARYLRQDLALARINPEISFNYLGQLDGVLPAGAEPILESAPEFTEGLSKREAGLAKNEQAPGISHTFGLLHPAGEETGQSIHPANAHGTVLDLVIMVVNGHLHINLHYHQHSITPQVARTFLQTYRTRLRDLLNHCMGRTEHVHTASDFAIENVLSDADFEMLKDIYDL